MTRSVEARGLTVQAAVAEALATLELRREQVTVEILEEPRPGLLGLFGGRAAHVRVSPLLPTFEEFSAQFLRTLLEKMGHPADDVRGMPADVDHYWYLEALGPGLEKWAGRRIQLVESLQTVVNVAMQRHAVRESFKGDPRRVIVDVGGIRKRRDESVRRLAAQVAARVRETGQAETLEAMNAHERKLIHVMFQDDPELQTQSEGQEPHRHIVIAPRKDA